MTKHAGSYWDALRDAFRELSLASKRCTETADRLADLLGNGPPPIMAPAVDPKTAARKARWLGEKPVPPPQKPIPLPPLPDDVDGDQNGLNKTERRILTALAQAGRPLSPTQIAIRGSMSPNTGGFNSALAHLRRDQMIANTSAKPVLIAITDTGLDVLGPFSRLPEGRELFEYWCAKLDTMSENILRGLAKHVGGLGLHRDELAAAIGKSPNTGGFNSAIAKMLKLELVVKKPDGLHLCDELSLALEPTVRIHDTSNGKQRKWSKSRGFVDE